MYNSFTFKASMLWLLLLPLLFVNPILANEEDDGFESFGELQPGFDDSPVEGVMHHPPWFRLSFLDLEEDLEEAIRFRKKGIVIYYSQDNCPYCQAMLDQNFSRHDVERYSRKNFDFVAIDIHGDKNVTDLNGEDMSEKYFADSMKVNFTPTMMFINEDGQLALRLDGYKSPYKFRAALEYVADGHYRNERFNEYLQRADPTVILEDGQLNESELFIAPPHNLNRAKIKGQRPMAVFFEQGDCHACDVLHSTSLQNEKILGLFDAFDVVQLDMHKENPVVTPSGEKTTSQAWSKKLGLYYTPTLLFFDESGEEIIRVDSVIGFFRLQRVLDYIISGAYRRGITLQQYRREKL